jgi:acyl-CoA thioesterase-1
VPRRSFLGALAISAAFVPRARAAGPVRILAFGDSLTAGYGLDDLRQAFPAQLERALRAKNYDVTVIQGGISGDTTTGGVNRLDWSLGAKPDAVILELGANDGLRAVDPQLTENNLRIMVTRIQKAGIPVLLTGMLAPPNLGREYGQRYKQSFEKVAKETGVLFYPFFLEEVAAVPDLNQADGLHPTPEGVAVVVKNILPSVEKLIGQVKDQVKDQAKDQAKAK